MLKRPGLPALLLALLAVCLFPCISPGAQKNARDRDENPQSPLDLALKGISLSQGEKGFEIWRLKAEWASLEKTDDTVITRLPRLTYFMKDGKSSIFVEAEQGEINQKTQILRFIGSVRATHEGRTLSGDLLIYNGQDKTMRMPEGGVFSAPDVSGNCRSITWLIDQNIIEASGGVSFFMETRERLASEADRLQLDQLTEELLVAPPPPGEQPD